MNLERGVFIREGVDELELECESCTPNPISNDLTKVRQNDLDVSTTSGM